MAAFVSNLTIYTHTDFEQSFILEDAASGSLLNLQNYIGSSQFKKYGSSSVAGTFNVEFVVGQLGKVKISLNSNQTSNLKPGKYFYDINITDTNNKTTRVVEGIVFIKKAVTR